MNRYTITTIEKVEHTYTVIAKTEEEARKLLANNCYDPESCFLDEELQEICEEELYYPCQETTAYYDAEQLKRAERLDDHEVEPSWGIYDIDGVRAVICDCDVRHAEGDE